MNSVPWYVTAFHADYIDRYAHRDEEEAKANIDALLHWLPLPRAGATLDLACGAGRHLIALHQAGFTHLVGLDLSADLLRRARRRLRELEIPNVRLVHSDMRDIGFAAHFDAVLSLFSSFGYFADDQQNAAVIHEIARALRMGGTALIDTMNPPHVQATLVPDEQFDLGSRHVQIIRRLTSDHRVEKRTILSHKGGQRQEFLESVRLYRDDEMLTMLEQAGFRDVHLAGALDGRDYSSSSPRLVVIATGGSPHA
ncbi:class I SAM-dependent methyltransferase [Candidatus Bipolaricaulota bacterium]|nr:class I SAM-dependent methyltransferase [Candidatus Bipolaricaulota bacterium]